MNYNLVKIRDNSESIKKYVTSKSPAFDRFTSRKAEYKLDEVIVRELKKYAKDIVVVVFSAEWCPDCFRNVPVLDMINEETGLEVRVFGHIMRNVSNTTNKWAIPPSPKEVEEFGVTKIPFIVILNQSGDELGKIIENPQPGKTLEQALLEAILKKSII